ncbi:bifunctional protein-serine/threonine kinase/phosphatase [Pseudorhodoferax sp.]|uniref:bifunctional protein-serine/threonine kinase/phosphatase n=1 Tax=Pseudorhodoferax sp. TaxID=1993553 RepID=UPI001B79CC91|nr:bifunctional protein-serine/threonine kinase/phosphatase [Pseudorhodoferax sp.]MBP8144150.1 bifunctional protein-serine/threonine kinase/phosphatase [Inhella sp.]
MSFDIDIGLTSLQGRRPRNEDFAGVQRPAAHELERGLVAALADGVSQGEDGLMAAQTTVMSLLADFHATPPGWDASVALERLLSQHNAWLLAHNRRSGRDALSTLTALALAGRRYALAHVGDSRAWLLRDGQCLQLTQDHRRAGRDFAALTRAMGLDDQLHLDHSQGELKVGDRLLLSSDGVHGSLPAKRIAALLREHAGAQAAADALAEAALAAGSSDNATALVLDVKDLAAPDLGDLGQRAAELPLPGLLGVGALLDDLQITAVVADSGVRRLLQARTPQGELVAVKLLHPSRAADAEERAMLAHEVWLGQRLQESRRRGSAAYPLVRVHATPAARHFYACFDWHGGQTLEQMLAAGPLAVDEALALARAAATALSLLHAARCVHRDLKPANLHRSQDGQWRLLDLGVALSPRAPRALAGLHAGTPSYINPEQWDEPPRPPDAGSDLYALGVTLYQALTGRLPFGELEPWQDARKRRAPVAVSRLNPQVPIWLDRLVMRAIARERKERFETADEWLLELERGAAREPATAPRALTLGQRDPLLLWQIGLGVSLLFNLLLVLWLLVLPKG